MENKVAIVTGAARGIGLAIAKRFAAEGAAVVLADVDTDRGVAAAEAIDAGGAKATFVACDVGDAKQAADLAAAAVATYGGLDICVNNAAVIFAADFLELGEADFDRVIRTNLKGSFLVGQAAAREMVTAGKGGSIINLSSVNSVMAIVNQTPYNVSKGGINQLTRVMALALAGKGIRVNAIGPGTILTEMARTVLTDEAARRMILSRTPLGRLGDVDEVARIAVFLATDDSSYITGQIIYCDGGRMALNYVVPVEE